MAVVQTQTRSAGTIMRDVRVAMDMNARSKALLDQSDIDTLTLDDIIVSKIIPGVKRIQQLAPSWMITCGIQAQNNSIAWESDRSIYSARSSMRAPSNPQSSATQSARHPEPR